MPPPRALTAALLVAALAAAGAAPAPALDPAPALVPDAIDRRGDLARPLAEPSESTSHPNVCNIATILQPPPATSTDIDLTRVRDKYTVTLRGRKPS